MGGRHMFAFLAGLALDQAVATGVVSPPPGLVFSWDTLPVFFHSQNSSGAWSDEAITRIAKFPVATFEKSHAFGQGGKTEENLVPPECQRVKEASNGTTSTVYYLNSAIDWPFNNVHSLMEEHPEYRAVDKDGKQILFGSAYIFNHSIDGIRSAWIDDCSAMVDAGCNGCFIDRSNNLTNAVSGSLTPQQASMYAHSHMQAIVDLNANLASKGGFAINNNEAAVASSANFMMLEDFAATEHCIGVLQEIVSRGLAVEAHAGDLSDALGKPNPCTNGDINAMAAFLIGAGKFSYYNCASQWNSNPTWPEVADPWLTWHDEFDRPIGTPLNVGQKGLDSIWRRSFESGTHVSFDPAFNNGTIWWSDGTTSVGPVEHQYHLPKLHHAKLRSEVPPAGCSWVTL